MVMDARERPLSQSRVLAKDDFRTEAGAVYGEYRKNIGPIRSLLSMKR